MCASCMTNNVINLTGDSNNNKRKGKRPRQSTPVNLVSRNSNRNRNTNQVVRPHGNVSATEKRDKLVFTVHQGEHCVKFIKKIMDQNKAGTLDLCKTYDDPKARVTASYIAETLTNVLKENKGYIAATCLVTATINDTLRGFALCYLHTARPETITKRILEISLICARGKFQIKPSARASSSRKASSIDRKYISGLGHKMMNCILRFAAQHKINLVQLTSVPPSVAAYKRMGFIRMWDACAKNNNLERAAKKRYQEYFAGGGAHQVTDQLKTNMEEKMYSANINRDKLDMLAMSKCIAKKAAKLGAVNANSKVQPHQFTDRQGDKANVIRFTRPTVRVLEMHSI